jgi:IS30 family transposase
MNSDLSSDSPTNRFENAVRNYSPKPPRKFQKLLPLKTGIAELRKRHASYQTITYILRDQDILVSCDTVFRFCHEVLREPKARYRRKRKPSTLRVRKQPDKPSPTPPVLSPGGSSQKPDRWTQVNGPRIADPNTI